MLQAWDRTSGAASRSRWSLSGAFPPLLTSGLENPNIRSMSKPSPRPLFLVGSKYLQIILIMISLVCLVYNSAMIVRNQKTREQLKPVIEDLKELHDKNTVSSKELDDIKNQLDPLMHPELHEPWPLRYTLPVGSGCILLSSLFQLQSRRRKSSEPLPEAMHQETVNG
jgi:hypothetical protein